MELDKIRFIGRYILKEGKPYFSYSGCGFSFNIHPLNNVFSITLSLSSFLREEDAQYIGIYVNDILHSKEKLIKGNNQINITLENSHEEVNITVIKLNETHISSIYLEDIILDDAVFLEIKPSNKPIIGFFGDSLTCGFGLIDLHGEVFKSSTEEFNKAYPYLTTKALDMDYTVIAKSGISIGIKVYCDLLFNEIYDTVDMFDKCSTKDHLSYAVINLGANDNSALKEVVKKEDRPSSLITFKKEYLKLVDHIIKDNPGVKLVLCQGMMDLFPEIVDLIKEIKEYIVTHYDNKCVMVIFKSNYDGASNHPYMTAHQEYSEVLVKAIKSL